MSEITITQLQEITGWQWNTAKKFIIKNGGQLKQDGMPRGRWYVPYTAVESYVNQKMVEAQTMQTRLMSISKNGN